VKAEQLPGMAPAKKQHKRSEAQRAASRRFFARFAPHTEIIDPKAWIEDDLAGARFYHALLGVVLTYQYTFTGTDGETYYEGTVTGRRQGVGIAFGSIWAARADILQRLADAKERP